MIDTFDVSVVCSTYQRADRLPALLAGLEAQTFPRERFEVVIVDDGSNDGTSARVASFAETSSLNLRLVTLPRNTGRSAGRNAGWRAATGRLVAFTDDDCVPAPGWLAAGVDAFVGDARVVVGRTRPNPAHEANKGPFSRTQDVDEASGTQFMHTCNVFYRRDDLASVDGFDDAFNAKGGEDTDLGWRVLENGGSVVFAPDAVVLHDITPGNFASALREAGMWRDIPRIAARHPDKVRPLLIHRVFWKRSHEYVVLAEVGVVAALLLRHFFPLVAVVPWLYWRGKQKPLARGKWNRVRFLPHAFVLDAVEVTTMVRGSAKNRTFVL